MSVFEDREKGEEAKFAHDQETQFRIRAHRNNLLASWAANKLALSEADTAAYIASVLGAAMATPTEEAILRKIHMDLVTKGVRVNEAEVRQVMMRLTEQATKDIAGKRVSDT
jgi:hypothetical protein